MRVQGVSHRPGGSPEKPIKYSQNLAKVVEVDHTEERERRQALATEAGARRKHTLLWVVLAAVVVAGCVGIGIGLWQGGVFGTKGTDAPSPPPPAPAAKSPPPPSPRPSPPPPRPPPPVSWSCCCAC